MGLSRRLLIGAGVCVPGMARAANHNALAAPQGGDVGVVLPASGPNALVGDECFRGIQMAVEDVNAGGGIGGKAVVLMDADAPGQDEAGVAAKRLLDGRAAFLLGSGTSAICYPGSAAAELAQVPYIELTGTADGIMERGFKFLLRTCETTTMIAQVAAGTILGREKKAKIALLFNTGATSGAVAAAAVAAFKVASITPMLMIGYPEDVSDLNDPVERMNRAGVDVVLHAGGADDVLLLFQSMGMAGWRPAAVYGCGDGYGMRETAYSLGSAFDGVFAVGAPFYPPRAGYLADAYAARFGMGPRSADSLTAYVGAKLVFDVLNLQNGDATKLLDGLRRTDIAMGALANGFGIAFDKSGQNTRSFVTLQQWRGQVLAPVG